MASEAQRVKFLIQKRGGIKSQLTTMEHHLESYLTKPNPKLLKAKFDRLKECFASFDDIQAELEALRNDDELDEERTIIEDRYVTVVTQVDDFLTTANSNGTSNAQCPCPTPASQTVKPVKLPKAELPHFDGKFEHWLSFRDRFTSMVDSQENISDAEKLNFLRSALSGEALEVIESFETTDENYSEAWEMLVHNYANERIIIMRHVQLLLEAPETDRKVPATLRKLSNHVQQHMRSLKSLGMPIDKWDMILIPILLPKLDETTRDEFEQTIKGNELPTITKLIHFITDRARTLEGSSSSRKPKASKEICQKTLPRNYPAKQQRPISTFVTTTPTTQDCGFCESTNHSIYRCDQFITASVPERLEAVRGKGLCLNCLRKGHSVQFCRSFSCKLCNKRHNTLVHHEDSRDLPGTSQS